jgi:hypothetical protein
MVLAGHLPFLSPFISFFLGQNWGAAMALSSNVLLPS